MYKPKTLVTGATGKTGSAVVSELLAKGWSVSALVRKRTPLTPPATAFAPREKW